MKKILTFLAIGAFAMVSQAADIKLTEVTPSSFVQGYEWQCSASGDINGDGRVDIIISGVDNDGGHSTVVYLSDATETFTVSTNSGIDKGVSHGWLDLGDQDGDGDLDLVMQGWYKPAEGDNYQIALVYNNDGNGVFTEVATLSTTASNGTIEWGDYDNDDDLDLVQVGWGAPGGKGVIYTNNGDNTFTALTGKIDGIADGHAKWGDYDNDGNLDVLLAGWNRVKVYKGDGTGNFTHTFGPLSQNYDFAFCDWVDFDNDSKLDFIIGGKVPGSDPVEWETLIFKGDGNGAFTDLNLGLFGVQKGPVVVADLDNDNYNDVVIAGWAAGGHFKVFQNEQTNTTLTDVTASLGITVDGWADGTMQVADFDNDGFLEVFKCGWNQSKLFTTKDLSTDIANNADSNAQKPVVYGATNRIVVQSNSQVNDADMVSVYDLSGRLIATKSVAELRMQHFHKGMYIVSIKVSEDIFTTKIIVQ